MKTENYGKTDLWEIRAQGSVFKLSKKYMVNNSSSPKICQTEGWHWFFYLDFVFNRLLAGILLVKAAKALGFGIDKHYPSKFGSIKKN